MKFLRYKPLGWRYDSYRHSLAARGISTGKRFSFQTLDNVSGESGNYEQDPNVESEIQGVKGGIVFKQKKISELTKLQRELQVQQIKEAQKVAPFIKSIDRIRSGNIDRDSINDALDRAVDERGVTDFAKLKEIQDAVYQGAETAIKTGKGYNKEFIKGMILENGEPLINDTRQFYLNETEKKFSMTRGARITRGAKAIGLAAASAAEEKIEETGKAVLSKGWKNLTEGMNAEPEESALDRAIRLKKEQPDELAEAGGTLNPFGVKNAFFGDSDTSKEEIVGDAIRIEKEVESVYDNRHKMASVDMGAYDKGMQAFARGDKEELEASLHDLTAKDTYLKNELAVLQQVNNLATSAENRDQLVHMDGSYSNPLLGGSGFGKLSDELGKITETRRLLLNSSNMVASRAAILRNRLERLKTAMPRDAGVPAKIKVIDNVSYTTGEGPGGVLSLNSLSSQLDSLAASRKRNGVV